MHFANFLNRTGQTKNLFSRRSFKPLAVVGTLLFMGLALRGNATPPVDPHVFVYISGSYQDVTSEIETIDGHTYVMTGSPFEVILDYTLGHVYDGDSEIIGFIQDESTNPPGGGG